MSVETIYAVLAGVALIIGGICWLTYKARQGGISDTENEVLRKTVDAAKTRSDIEDSVRHLSDDELDELLNPK